MKETSNQDEYDKLIQIFEELQMTASKNEKMHIIKENSYNKLFIDTISFLLDTHIVTGISNSKIHKTIVITDEPYLPIINSWEECMEYIKKNNTGRDCDIREIQYFLSSISIEHRKFFDQIITKSLRIGCDVSTVNKAIPKLIDTWEVQLGSAFDKLKLKQNELFFLSKKMNGNRCSFINGKLISRQGNEFIGLQHIINDIISVGLQDMFIDGELVGKNVDNLSDDENFRVSTGIINSDDCDKSSIKFVIFDMFPAQEIINKQSNDSYSHRKASLLKLKEQIQFNHLENIDVVEMVYEGIDTSKIDEWLEYAVSHDWEGLMLNKDSTYKCKRTTDLIKVKRFYTMDLPVAAYEEGTGRLSGTLGALVVDFNGNTVNVGSGFDDATRSQIWANREDIIGSIIEVKYKCVSIDKNTHLKSLQFPIFVRIREDKNEVSYD